LRARPTQTANIFEVQDGAGLQLFYVAANGRLRVAGGIQSYGTDLSLDLYGSGTGVVRAGNLQVETKGHKHVAADVTGAESTANKGAANGYASLDATTRIPAAQLPTTVVQWVAIPPTSSSPGVMGQMAHDGIGGWLYVCVATDQWRRTALTTW
jgi:hypothetical protein